MKKSVHIFLTFAVLMSVPFFAQGNEESLTPDKWGTFCPSDFTQTAPQDFHTNIELNYVAAKEEELHRIVCERFDAKTMQLKARWNLFFCEDLNVNNYQEKEFYVPLTPWFTFHPNFKKMEFMLFPKHTKLIRHMTKVNGEMKEVSTLHFMRNHESEMEIIFRSSTTNKAEALKSGSRSISALIFINTSMQTLEDPVSCEISK